MVSLYFTCRPARRFLRTVATGLAIATALGTVSPSAFAQGAPLTLAEAQRRAVERSKQLAAKEYAISASRDMAVAAAQLPDPVLKAGIDNLPVSGRDRFSLTDDFMTMRRIGVMQEITRSDKRTLRAERFNRSAEKTIAEKDVTTAAIERDTALAWLDLYYVQKMAALVNEQGSQAKLEMQAADGAYRSGRGTQADVFASRSAAASFEDRSSEYRRRILNAKTQLARWVGNGADLPLAGTPDTNVIRLDPATLDTQLAHHPDIAVYSKKVEIAETEARLAQANKKSDWTVELAYQQRGPAYSNMASIGVSIPLQWNQKNRQDRELSSKLALIEEAKGERDEMLRDHVAQTKIMIDEWENDRERSARYERDIVPLAAKRTLAGITAYSGGKTSLNDVLSARRNEIDVRLQALQLQADTARLWAQLNFLFPTGPAFPHAESDPRKDVQ